MRAKIQPNAATGEKSAAIPDASQRYGDKNAVAAMVGVSRRTIDNFLKAGCPHLKIGSRRVRFDLGEVRDWLKQQYGVQRRA